ncbi:MAG: SusC/RagA family TonB-linked outer membrane protein, partial [Cyclobacteriaceae bacterium]
MENTFTKKMVFLLFTMTILIVAGLKAQGSRELSGKVTNTEGLTMPGVTVVEKGTTNGTVTDVNGNYSFTVSENAETLVFSFVGMETKEIIIGNQSQINVSLEDDTADLEEVVVVGYGEQRKATLTGSIASTDETRIKKAPVTSLSNSLSGLLPGLTTLNRSGQPGENNAQIFIRGRSTTGNSSPLVVIDGVPDETGAWQRINQNDIEQVSILKDASASIYGARAANGVILITTKRGSIGKPVFSYTFNQGITQPTRLPEMANSWEFADYVNQYRTTIQNLPPLYSDQEIQTMRDGTDPLNFPNTDWVGTVFKDFTPQSMHNLNVRGGTERARYSMSGSYIDENSIVENGIHGSNAFTLRTNVDVDITDNFRFGLDVNGEMDNRKRPVLGGFGTQGSPLIPAFYPNGLPASLPGDAGENPAINLAGEGGYFSDNIYRTFLKPSFNINIPQIEGLGLDGYVSYRQEYTEGRRWRDTWLVYNYDAENDEFLEKQGGQVSQPDLQEMFNKEKDYLMHFKIKYAKTFGDHMVESFVAFEQAEGEFRTITAYRRGFISSSIEELFAGSGENMVADGTRRQWGRQNIF